MVIQLPNGLLDGADLFNYAEVDELRGKQQNYLANRELVVGNIGHIPKILEDCVLALQTKEGLKWGGQMKDAIAKLSVGDIEALLIKIRLNTYGERFYFNATCPHCDHENKELKLELDKLELDVMALDQMMDKARVTFKLPKSGKEVEVRPLYMADLFESLKVVKTKADKLVTSVIALSLKRIDQKTKVTSEDIDELPAKDLMFLREQLEKIKLEGTIDTKILHDCNNCGKEFETKLDVYSSDFFDPSKGSMTSRT
jgi:hypothetical protein